MAQEFVSGTEPAAASGSDSEDRSSSGKSKVRSRVGAAGRGVYDASMQSLRDSAATAAGRADAILDSMARGGKVRKDGVYRLHKNERVLNVREAKRYRGGRKKKGRKSGRL